MKDLLKHPLYFVPELGLNNSKEACWLSIIHVGTNAQKSTQQPGNHICG